MSNLTDHANTELKAAGLFDKDSDYDGMLGNAVLELVKVFAAQGHSGYSAAMTLDIFAKVASYQPLTAIGQSIDEWVDQSAPSGEPLWQNKRRGTTFSRDQGKTWYDIDNPELNSGDTWGKRPECPAASQQCKVYLDETTARPHQWCCGEHGVIIVHSNGKIELAPF